jgi:hypothetical protein
MESGTKVSPTVRTVSRARADVVSRGGDGTGTGGSGGASSEVSTGDPHAAVISSVAHHFRIGQHSTAKCHAKKGRDHFVAICAANRYTLVAKR